MKRNFLILVGILISFCCECIPSAFGQTIPVEVSGSGITESKALHDAMKRAIVKAVGAYVATKSTLRDNQRSEEIIVNSDARVTKYKILSSEEKNGVWIVKIKASVLPNEYLKYCPKTTSQKVSTLETGNIVNQRKALKAASQTLHNIFQNYSLNLYRLSRIDKFKIAADDDFNSDMAKVTLDFKVRIDQKAYRKIQNQLCSLLNSIAYQKASHKFDLRRISDILKSLPPTCKSLKENAGVDENNAGFVLFMEYGVTNVNCKLYLVQRKVFEMIADALTFESKNIICSVSLKDKENSEKYIFPTECFDFCSIFYKSYDDDDDDNIIVFQNRFKLRGYSYLSVKEQDFCFQNQGTMRMSMAAENFDNDKIKELKIYALFFKEDYDNEKINELASEAETKIFVNSPDSDSKDTVTSPNPNASASDVPPDVSSDVADADDSPVENEQIEETSWSCPSCNGKKVIIKDIEKKNKCKKCVGKGYIIRYTSGGFNPHNFDSNVGHSYRETCTACSGQGFFVTKKRKSIQCPECSKSGDLSK